MGWRDVKVLSFLFSENRFFRLGSRKPKKDADGFVSAAQRRDLLLSDDDRAARCHNEPGVTRRSV